MEATGPSQAASWCSSLNAHELGQEGASEQRAKRKVILPIRLQEMGREV